MIKLARKRAKIARRPAPVRRSEENWALRVSVNGEKVRIRAQPAQTLLDFLRLELGLTGTKGACLEGECGSCYVLVDGKPVNSCLVLVAQVQGREILTIEGTTGSRQCDIIRQKFIECGAVQCGYCTPGLILAASALLMKDPHPAREDILVGMEGNICRCTGYNTILRAVEEAAEATGAQARARREMR